MHLPDPRTAAQLLGGEVDRRGSINCPAPGHSSKDRSLWVTLDAKAPGGILVNCRGVKDDPLACKDYVRQKLGLPEWKPGNGADNRDSETKPKSRVVAEYVYRQADGSFYLKVLRKEPKEFLQKRWNGKDWEWGGPQGAKLPYLLPEILDAHADVPVFVVEGEKDADNLAALGLVATTNAGGAGNWTAELNEWFRGRTIYILPDADKRGRDHAQQVAEQLTGIAAEVRVVPLPDLPDKGDVSNWLAAGGTARQLIDLCTAADAHVTEPPPKLIKSSADFVRGFTPPDYLVDRLVQRRFIYSFTGQTGSGKTAVALLAAYCVGQGVSIGEREVQRGRVLYFAGENPDDVRMRWIAMAEHLRFDLEDIDVNFIDGVVSLEELDERIRREVRELGGVSLIVVDTSAAYFLGDDENNNPAMGAYARRLRRFTNVEGGPTVLVNCHPVKNAAADNLIPRGGGAFLAEVDGNLTCSRTDTLITLYWQGKFRGADFEPLTFETRSVTAESLKDARGRSIYTVLAAQLSQKDVTTKASETREREDKVIIFMATRESPPSIAAIAEHLGFKDANGNPMKGKAHRVVERLKRDKLITNERGDQYRLTDKGQQAAKTVQYNRDAAGASYG